MLTLKQKIFAGVVFFWCLFIIGALFYSWVEASSLDYRAYANKMEEKYELPKNLLVSICDYENRSQTWRNVAGGHGEIGVCQIKPSTVAMLCGDCTSLHGNIVYGDTGDEVRAIQTILSIKVDGIYGPQTLSSILSFQRAHKLVQDGVVGKHTWYAMTGKHRSYKSITDQLWEPRANIEYAAKYLVFLRDYVGDDITLMIAAYNGGHGNPVVTYAKKVTALMRLYE